MIRRLFSIACVSLLVACSGSDTTSPGTDTPDQRLNMTSMERGAILYKRCRACHTLDEGGRHKVGPNLWGVHGRQAGTREEFNYSKAMVASDIIWDDETLTAYIENPAGFMPGNRMSFVGLRKAEDQAALLEYLKAETGAEG